MQDSTNRDRLDFDPANSSFPPGPLRPLVPLDRAAEMVTQQRDDAAREALMAVRRALRAGVAPSSVLVVLDYAAGRASAASLALEALGDLAAQAGGR